MPADFPHPTQSVPDLTTAQMVEVDRAMVEDYGIALTQMMENAGRNLAHLARVQLLDGNPQKRNIVVMAGAGGNGGGALVCARRLHNWGARVSVLLSKAEEQFDGVPAQQLAILRKMQVAIQAAAEASFPDTPDLIIDGLIGYSLHGDPRGAAADLIRWANQQSAPVLSLDVPSGFDGATGRARTPSVAATATLTLALPKQGMRDAANAAVVGQLYLADISVPPALYSRPPLLLEIGKIFAQSDILRLNE